MVSNMTFDNGELAIFDFTPGSLEARMQDLFPFRIVMFPVLFDMRVTAKNGYSKKEIEENGYYLADEKTAIMLCEKMNLSIDELASRFQLGMDVKVLNRCDDKTEMIVELFDKYTPYSSVLLGKCVYEPLIEHLFGDYMKRLQEEQPDYIKHYLELKTVVEDILYDHYEEFGYHMMVTPAFLDYLNLREMDFILDYYGDIRKVDNGNFLYQTFQESYQHLAHVTNKFIILEQLDEPVEVNDEDPDHPMMIFHSPLITSYTFPNGIGQLGNK